MIYVKFQCERKELQSPSKKICGKLNMRFLVNSIPSVFRGLKFTSHCLAHADRICKS